MALKPWLAGALLLCALAASCREVSLCADLSQCTEEAAAGGGSGPGAPVTGGSADSAGSRNTPTGGSGGNGGSLEPQGGGGDDGQSGESGAPVVSVCPMGFAECDGSTLSECETNLLESVRHCGACASECDGLCVVGTCKPGELLFEDSGPDRFVATQSTAFTIMGNFANTSHTLYMFDLLSGEAKPLRQYDFPPNSLSIGNDHVYVEYGEVLAFSLDGSRVEPVQNDVGPIYAQSFGATEDGLYYVDYEDTESDGEVYTLFYRPNGATKWQAIHQGGEIEIMGAGLDAIALVGGNQYDEVRELFMVADDDVTPLGPLPEGWNDLLVVEDKIVVLVYATELWWFDAYGEPAHYPIEGVRYPSTSLMLVERGVALQVQSGSSEIVRSYELDGPNSWAYGISRTATACHLTRTHLWYVDMPSYIDPPLLKRSRLLEESDL